MHRLKPMYEYYFLSTAPMATEAACAPEDLQLINQLVFLHLCQSSPTLCLGDKEVRTSLLAGVYLMLIKSNFASRSIAVESRGVILVVEVYKLSFSVHLSHQCLPHSNSLVPFVFTVCGRWRS